MIMQTASSVPTLVAGERFFLKQIDLDAAVAPAAQVEMALEESAPFPLTQLYYGFVVGADGAQALVYAAYRRRFTEAETAEWPAAAAVLPDFLGLLGPAPDRPLFVLQAHPGGLRGVAWDGRARLPVATLMQATPEPPEEQVKEMIAELSRRTGLADVEVKRLDGAIGVGQDESGGAIFRIAGEETARFPAAAVVNADVRDKPFLHERRRDEARRRGWVWALRAVSGLLLVAVGLELAIVALGAWNERRRARVTAQAGEVARIETAQTLATRIEDLAAREEKPLEWLSLVSSLRPRSVQFIRVVSNNDRSLVVDAQTGDAAAVGAYETILRQRPEIAGVEVRDIRSRDGLTNFALAVQFKPALAGNPEEEP